MANYAVYAVDVTTASPEKAICDCTSDGTVRPGVYDIILGSDDTPQDYAAKFHLERITAVGTGATAVTPEPLDPISAAAQCSANRGAYTMQPTVTANTELLTISMNQRATFRWVAAPGSYIYGIATSASGLAINCVAVSTAWAADATLLFAE